MCFSFEVSLATGLFSWAVSLYMLKNYTLTNDQYHTVIMLMIFSSMQFADAILWKSGMKKNSINFMVTSYLIPAILCAQVAYNLFVKNGLHNNPLAWAATIGLVVWFFNFFHGYSHGLCGSKFASPVWGGQEIPIWALLTFAALALYPGPTTMQAGTLGLTLLLAPKKARGSMWCAVACASSMKYLVDFK